MSRLTTAFIGLALILSCSPAIDSPLAGPRRPAPGAPDVDDIQKAYAAARTTAAPGRHHDDLSIRDADCSQVGATRFTCEVDFVRRAEPAARLFFTVVTMEGAPHRWALIGGLCQSP